MSTGWEGIRQVCATLLGARYVPERLCGGPCPQRGAVTSVRPLRLLCTTFEFHTLAVVKYVFFLALDLVYFS